VSLVLVDLPDRLSHLRSFTRLPLSPLHACMSSFKPTFPEFAQRNALYPRGLGGGGREDWIVFSCFVPCEYHIAGLSSLRFGKEKGGLGDIGKNSTCLLEWLCFRMRTQSTNDPGWSAPFLLPFFVLT
jgi:hypothetical protein